MPSITNKIKLLSLFMVIATLGGCVNDPICNKNSDSVVDFRVALRSTDISLNAARFIVLNQNTIIKNDIIPGSNNYFSLKLKAGDYRMIIVANESPDMALVLQNAMTYDDLKAVQVSPFLKENSMVYISNNEMSVTAVPGKDDQGQVSIDGGAVTQAPEIPLQRAHAKTTFYVRKYTKLNAQANDRITVKKVTLCHLPDYSYLMPGTYTGSNFIKHVLYDNSTGILLDQDVTDQQFAIKDDITGGAYRNVVAAIPQDAEPTNIFPEYLMQSPTATDQAAYLQIEATYTSNGTNTDVSYTVPPLRADQQIEDYQLRRNCNYEVYLTLTKKGDFDAFEVTYSIKDWEGKEINVGINKDPFLDITNIEVNAYDAAATRVYFYSNQPADQVYISSTGHIGSASGTSFNVKDVFHKLVQVTDENGIPVETANNFHYDFNTTTATGKGYVDIINLNTATAGNQARIIHLIAGKLERTITVNSIVTEEAAKHNATPYIGTFHRSEERSERIVTWHATGEWTATIRTTAGLDFTNLMMDKLASPAYGKGLFTQQNPMNPEGAEVSDGTSLQNGKRTISGKGRVYFRVGWANFATGSNGNRYALIDVSYNDNSVTQTLYCRQGETPEELVAGNPILMAAYNVDLPDQFTTYPTMAGYFYQWNDRTAYSPVGSIVNYNTTQRHATFDETRSVCPEKYGYPDQKAIETLDPILDAMPNRWGYYADGYFDRRPITDHSVAGSGVGVAYAGNLFYNPVNGKSVFTPTGGARDNTGAYSRNAVFDDNATSILMAGFWGNYNAADPDHAIMITQHSDESKKTKVNSRDKLTGLNVRCIRILGNTLSFNTNGGAEGPRSITLAEGSEITIPDGPSVSRSAWHFCVAWNSRTDGTGTIYKFGEKKQIGKTDETLYAMWELIENLRLTSGNENIDFIADNELETRSYNSWTTVAGLNNGTYRTTEQNSLTEAVYPYLQLSDTYLITTATTGNMWDTARETCRKMSPEGSWRLPRASELYWLYKYDNTMWSSTGYIPFATGTEKDSNNVWAVYPKKDYDFSGMGGTLMAAPKSEPKYFRCIKEIRSLK